MILLFLSCYLIVFFNTDKLNNKRLTVRVSHLWTLMYRRYFCAACGRREQLLVRISQDQGTYRRISYIDHFLRRRDNIKEVSIPDSKMGRRRGRGQEALGMRLFFHSIGKIVFSSFLMIVSLIMYFCCRVNLNLFVNTPRHSILTRLITRL